eukprot:m.103981 g.103981  ORF g.103981 m.103981 type:complete len:675 (-) comp13830_c0_seq2:42-2066(-)
MAQNETPTVEMGVIDGVSIRTDLDRLLSLELRRGGGSNSGLSVDGFGDGGKMDTTSQTSRTPQQTSQQGRTMTDVSITNTRSPDSNHGKRKNSGDEAKPRSRRKQANPKKEEVRLDTPKMLDAVARRKDVVDASSKDTTSSSASKSKQGGHQQKLFFSKPNEKKTQPGSKQPTTTEGPVAQQLLGMESEIAKLKKSVEIRDERIKGLENEVSDHKKNMDAKTKIYRDALRETMRDKAIADSNAAREKYLLNVQRLGWFQAQRVGHTIQETWADGMAYRQLQLRRASLAERMKILEEQKKAIKAAARKKSVSTNAKNAEGFPTPTLVPKAGAYNVQSEIRLLNGQLLNKEEQDLAHEEAALHRERNLHFRETKRVLDEEQSKYKIGVSILHDRYILMSLLGRGGFSEVFKAYDLMECRYVACKLHQLSSDWNDAKKENYIKHATREYEIHKDLHHENVTELYDVFEIDENSFCTVLEFCDGNDLDFQLKQCHSLSERDAKSKLVQIVDALVYLNKQNPPIIHYDLKPANVLLVDGQVKLTDFGLSKQLKDSDSSGNMELTSQGAGTYWYLPPECFAVDQTPKISSKVDVWSVGVLFYQCLFGQKPFGHNMTQQSILKNKTILNARSVQFPDKKSKVSEDAKAFIRYCLTYEMHERPDVFELHEHSYLRQAGKGSR